jgi:hypothetical protein
VPGEPIDGVQIGPPGVGRQVLQIHLPNQLLPQGCPGLPPWFGVNKLKKVFT